MGVPWYRTHRLLSPTAWALPCVIIFESNSFLGWRCVSCKAWVVHWIGHRSEVYVKMFHYVQTLWMASFQTVEVRKWINGLFFFLLLLFTIISYIKIPNVHQSTALVCPQPLMTSGAIYSNNRCRLLFTFFLSFFPCITFCTNKTIRSEVVDATFCVNRRRLNVIC